MDKITILLVIFMMTIVSTTNAYSQGRLDLLRYVGAHNSNTGHHHTSHCDSCCHCGIHTHSHCHSCCECHPNSHHDSGWECTTNCPDHAIRDHCIGVCKSTETIPPPTQTQTTHHVITTQQGTHTTPQGTYHSCDKYSVVEALAINLKANDTSSGTCQGTDKKERAEAFVSTHCNTGQYSGWKMGAKIMDNCQELYNRTPYVAIAVFHKGLYASSETRHHAGVLVGCEADGFKIAVQTCVETPFIAKITGDHRNAFHVILTN